MALHFSSENPYSRQNVMDAEAQFEVRHIYLQGIVEPTVEDYLPPSVHSITIDCSPNVTFSVPFPDVHYVTMLGAHIAFDDAMFQLQLCQITSSDFADKPYVYLEPGQLKLRNTEILSIRNAVLHADSLRDAHVETISLRFCQDDRPISMIVPVIADGVDLLTVHAALAAPGGIHLASVPDSLTKLRIPQNELSVPAMEMLHVHNQRLRYMHGPNAAQSQLLTYNRDLFNFYEAEPVDFTQENADRDLNVQRIREALVQKFGDSGANQILQNMYGEHYGQAPRFGGGGWRGYRKKKRNGRGNGKMTKRGKKKSHRKSHKKSRRAKK